MSKSTVDVKSKSKKSSIPQHYIVLQYPTELTLIQQGHKAGCFVGSKGVHLQLFENEFHIRINIINTSSRKDFQQFVEEKKKQNEKDRINGLWLLMTSIDKSHDEKQFDVIKAKLIERWEQIDVSPKKRTSRRFRSCEKHSTVSTARIEKDSRWKPKKQRKYDKNERKQKKSKANRTNPS
jgi:hypothetical protein